MSRWRDISTYRPGVDPKKALLFDPEDDNPVGEGQFVGVDEGMPPMLGWSGGVVPTHWQPLPPLPGEEGDALEWKTGVKGCSSKTAQACDKVFAYYAFSDDGLAVEPVEFADHYGDQTFFIHTRDQAAAMELAQGISDLIRVAQEEPGGGTT